MSDLIKREDAIKAMAKAVGRVLYDAEEISRHVMNSIPTIEPNLILPERMERGECYEVGETIVVLNHDDYYDLLCKPTVDKDYLIKLIQEAVYDGEACKRLLDLVEPKKWFDDGFRLGKQVTEYNNKPKQGEWIPCSERLPEENGESYLTYQCGDDSRYGWCQVLRYDDGWNCLNGDKSNEIKCVVAWMPLPTEYRGE